MLDPLSTSSWTIHHAAHLLNRAGFGGTPEEVKALYEEGIEKAVKEMIEGRDDSDILPPPSWLKPQDTVEFRQALASAKSEEERKKIQRERDMVHRDDMLLLRQWWVNRMRYTTWPLREKLTLFWHGHFATSIDKVGEPYWMYLQNAVFRAQGLGSSRDLVKWMTRDPAMIRWLDLAQSNLQHPNENFARELMELFTLGEGHYTEQDIRESARAFTGYRIDPAAQRFVFVPRQHDEKNKTFMGKTGNFDGDDIVNSIFERPECARFLARKIWNFFVYENPPEDLVDALAQNLRANDYHLGKFLTSVFQSAEFYSKEAYRMQIKSPMQWVVQTSRSLEVGLPDAKVLDGIMRQMGQLLFAPPNVKGWDGNRSWISTSTLLFRYNLAGLFVSTNHLKIQGLSEGKKMELSLEKIAPREVREDDELLVSTLEYRLYNTALPPKDRATCLIYAERYHGEMTDDRIRDLILMMMSTPEFQLV